MERPRFGSWCGLEAGVARPSWAKLGQAGVGTAPAVGCNRRPLVGAVTAHPIAPAAGEAYGGPQERLRDRQVPVAHHQPAVSRASQWLKSVTR